MECTCVLVGFFKKFFYGNERRNAYFRYGSDLTALILSENTITSVGNFLFYLQFLGFNCRYGNFNCGFRILFAVHCLFAECHYLFALPKCLFAAPHNLFAAFQTYIYTSDFNQHDPPFTPF